MEDGSLMLVGASGDQEIRNRYTMPALRRQLMLSRAGDCDRLGIDAKLVEGAELLLELFEGSWRTRAVQELEPRDRAEAGLPERRIEARCTYKRGLVQQ